MDVLPIAEDRELLAAESNRTGFWGDKGRVGEQYSSLRLYTNISCVIQAARASGGLGGVGNYKPMVSTIRQFRQQLGDSNVLGALGRCDRTNGLSKTHL